MNNLAIFSIVGLLLIPVGYSLAFAETFQVNIPSGAADPNAPFFFSPWELTVNVGDKVEWQNADTAAHTVTSGENATPDGRFDSGLIQVGKTFVYQFTESDKGVVKYYCSIHPFMIGTVDVGHEAGYKVFHNVGSDVGDKTFDLEYKLDRILSQAKVDQARKSITFTLAGVGSGPDKFVVKLPQDLIGGPLQVWIDEVQITNFEQNTLEGITTLSIPLQSDSELVTVVGTSVVPEFGTIAALIFAISIIATITVSTKKFSLPKLRS